MVQTRKGYTLKLSHMALVLALILLVTAPGCTGGNGDPAGTDPSDTAVSGIPNESGTASGNVPSDEAGSSDQPGTSPVDPDPIRPAASVESLALNGQVMFPDEAPAQRLEADGYTVTTPEGIMPVSLTLGGWVGFDSSIDAFGYCIDGTDPVFGNFELETEEAVKAEGGTYAKRFSITVPLFELNLGDHRVAFLARLADGTLRELIPTLTLILDGVTADTSIPYHSSVTQVNGGGPGAGTAYTGRGGNTDRGTDTIDCRADGKTASSDGKVTVSGWIALSGGVDHYVWSADGKYWYPAATGGKSGESLADRFTALGFSDAADNAVFQDLALDLSRINGQTVSVTLGAVPKADKDKVVPFLTLENLYVPLLPEDIHYTYKAQADRNTVGTDLAVSDLREQFILRYGAGDTHTVLEQDGRRIYALSGIHAFESVMDGCFALSARIQEMTGTGFLFVRGTQSVVSVDPVNIPCHNFFETDGAGLCGGAGIYAQMKEGKLILVIKGLDPSAAYRIRNYIFEYSVSGSELTLADDGRSVHVLVDGQEITSVLLEGEQEYPEHLQSVSPFVRFAATATVTMADGRKTTVKNTLVASSCLSQCGMAVRGGAILFTGISVMPYSEYAQSLK